MAASHWDECAQCERIYWNDRGSRTFCGQVCANKARYEGSFGESFTRFLNQPETVNQREAIVTAWKRVFR